MTLSRLQTIAEETPRELFREITISDKVDTKTQERKESSAYEEKKSASQRSVEKMKSAFFEDLSVSNLYSIFSFIEHPPASFILHTETAQAVFQLSKKMLKKRAEYLLIHSREIYLLFCKCNFFSLQIPESLTQTLFAARRITHLKFDELLLQERLLGPTENIEEEQTRQSCCTRFLHWICCISEKKQYRHYAGLQDVVRYFPYLLSLNLNSTTLDEKSSFYFSKLTNLRTLTLSKTNIKDSDFSHISTLPLLSSLDLSFCNSITTATLTALQRCTQLQSLKIKGCASLKIQSKQLNNFPKLSLLDLSECQNTNNETLKEIGMCKRLHSLYLNNCYYISTLGIKNLAELSLLEHLELENCPQLDSTVVAIITKQFRYLKTLNLSNLKVTDLALKQLTSLKKLTTLNLSDCEVMSKDSLLILAEAPLLQRLYLGKLGKKQLNVLNILRNRNKKLHIFIDTE